MLEEICQSSYLMPGGKGSYQFLFYIRKFLPEEKVWMYITQLVLALHACHNHGETGVPGNGKGRHKAVLHRDLKPANGT